MLTNSHTLTQLPSRTFLWECCHFHFHIHCHCQKPEEGFPCTPSRQRRRRQCMRSPTPPLLLDLPPGCQISNWGTDSLKMATKWVQFVPYYVSSLMCWCISVGKCFPLMVFCRKVGQMFCYWQNFCSYRALFSVWPLFDWIFDRTWFMFHHL